MLLYRLSFITSFTGWGFHPYWSLCYARRRATNKAPPARAIRAPNKVFKGKLVAVLGSSPPAGCLPPLPGLLIFPSPPLGGVAPPLSSPLPPSPFPLSSFPFPPSSAQGLSLQIPFLTSFAFFSIARYLSTYFTLGG